MIKYRNMNILYSDRLCGNAITIEVKWYSIYPRHCKRLQSPMKSNMVLKILCCS